MRRPRLPSFLLPLLALALLPAPGVAADEAETRARLEELRERIDAVQGDLREERERRDEASATLARLEQRIGSIANRIDDLDTRIDRSRRRLDQLEARRRELVESLEGHRDTLAEQLRAAHRFGRQPALRLLLRQDSPGTLARALGYYGYFNRARLGAIDEARSLMDKIAGVTQDARAAREELATAREGLESQRARLEQASAERRQVVERLQASIAEKGDELERLQASRERLRELLEKLGNVMDDIPGAPLEERPFDTQRNALDWPAGGDLRVRYGSERASGRTRWRGLVIDAAAGEPVRAVYHGRVVFADWLEGFGQLLIVDHQDGWLSLYGYNRQLLRSTGDWVAPGEAIARVGASGGQREPGLYFEIRRQGQPVDPMDWLAAR
ncbi:murein hydrolase activator EnvC family protein [Halofilum ochraceum]|uniref:murein hydrolase activator EnvC family protein n=1 Tax=Halofilum ochraceum TaxID=1611323 RepID=UPI0008DA4910|nr:peptidoglycan DD-metalloendopeptidase family protein [Halofilum ochraceum]